MIVENDVTEKDELVNILKHIVQHLNIRHQLDNSGDDEKEVYCIALCLLLKI